ncbi:hypothetical protein AB0I55_07735 [Actinocatenispora sera]|uniref:hypothetical protein n=1 Tax=Actinocatenispora sera TaxID=390989 RepID=UPI003409BD07
MTIDASRNTVTFRLGSDRTLTAEVPARAADGIRRAWRTVADEHDARPETVTAIDCRWQPSVMDTRYLELTFDDVDVTYAFARPAVDGWDAALADATRALEDAPHQALQHPTAPRPAAEAATSGDHPGELLPVVHSMSLPAGRELWDTVPAFAVVDTALFATLARITTTPDGMLAAESVGWDEISGQDEFLSMAKDAALRLMAGLDMETVTSDGEIALVRIRHDEQVAGSAIVLANLHGTILERYGWDAQIVAIPYPNELMIVPADSPAMDQLRALVRNAEARSATFRPTLIRLTATGREILLEGGAEPEPTEDPATDPAVNVVNFHRGTDDVHSALMTARDDHAVRRAWAQVVERDGVRAGQVTAVAAHWEPSAADKEFIAETFGDVQHFFIMGRPDENGWDEAYETARRLNKEVQRQRIEEELANASQGILESTRDAAVLPVLRSTSLPSSDWIKETRPSWPVVGDAIYATLARVALTPRGTVGMGHILHSQVTDDEDFQRQAADAVAAVLDGLVLEATDELGAADEPGGDTTCRVTRRDGLLAAGAICLPDFHERICAITGWPELVIAITCPDHMYLARPGTPAADTLRTMVAESAVEDRELRPTLLRCTADGFELLLESAL